MPIYNRQLKQTIKVKAFFEKISAANLSRQKYTLLVFLFWTGVRISEALRLTNTSFYVDGDRLYARIGKRLKKGKVTKDLPLHLELPGVQSLIEYLPEHPKPWPFSRKTAWRLCKSLGWYPHYFRMNRASWFAKRGLLMQMMQWFGWQKLETAASYFADIQMRELGDALLKLDAP